MIKNVNDLRSLRIFIHELIKLVVLNKIMKGFFSFLIFIFASSIVCAQAPTAIEKKAEQGYANRFIDTLTSLHIQYEALSLAQQTHDRVDEAICHAYLAMTYRRMLNLKDFRKNTELAYDIANNTKNERAIAYGNWTMGLLRSYIDDKTAALDYMLKAYVIFQKIHEYRHCAKLGADISYLFSTGVTIKSKKYADEALTYAVKSNDPESILHARLAVGSYLSDHIITGRWESWQRAVDFFKETIVLAGKDADRIISKSNIGIAHINLAELYMNGPSPIDEHALLSNLETATDIGKKYNLRNVYRSSLGIRGQYFVEKKEYRMAERLFKEGIAFQQGLPYKDNDLFAAFYNCLKDLAAREGDHQSYYEYDKLFVKYNQLKYDESIQEKLQNTDARFEAEKRIARITQLEKENELQKKNKLLSYSISGILLIGLVFVYRSYHYRKCYYQNREDILQQQQANAALKVQLMEKESLETLSEKIALERRLLQSQMDPHFMFNILGSIQNMILQSDRVTAVGYLGKFAKLIRQVLEQSRMESICLTDEINTLNHYIELQQLRLNYNFDYEIKYGANVDTNIHIPPLLIQPFVENAIEHGLKPLTDSRRGLLQISFTQDIDRNVLICSIVDNGIGLRRSKSDKTQDSHQSLSTKITDERLLLMQQQNAYTKMEIHDRKSEEGEKGCIVRLTIPIL